MPPRDAAARCRPQSPPAALSTRRARRAAQHGAAMLNHTEVVGLLTEGGKPGDKDYRVVGAKVRAA